MYYIPQLTNFADAVANVAGQYLVALAAIGALSMAVVQAVKELTDVRARFQRRAFRAWLERSASSGKATSPATSGEPSSGTPPLKASAGNAETDLIRLATAGDADALFDLEIEKLAGQLSAAAAIVVDFPGAHRHALLCLAADADVADVKNVLEASDLGRAHLENLRTQPTSRGQYDKYVDSKARVMHQIQRNIDAFQISTGFRWKWWLQIAASAIAYVLTMIGLGYYAPPGVKLWNALKAVPFAFFAGLFAPIARDLMVLVGRARKG